MTENPLLTTDYKQTNNRRFISYIISRKGKETEIYVCLPLDWGGLWAPK